MSGIAGIIYFDGKPVAPTALTAMLSAIAHRGPDRAGQWLQGSVGMGHVMLCTTSESLGERQPLLNETGELCLVLDGRIDNREELWSELKARGAMLRDDGDAELVLRSYEIWGEGCAAKLLGDFAFAIWDGGRRQLYCARDITGVRPFYYCSVGATFLFASELQALLADPAVPRKPNEAMIAEYLTSTIASQEETLYESIQRLPASHFLVVSGRGVQKRRYWDVDPGNKIRYGNDGEYAEHFRGIFEQAVRCRLRTCVPVAAEVSGGLDSSSVVGMVEHLRATGKASLPAFRTFSFYDPNVAVCDEREFIRDVKEMWGLDNELIHPPQKSMDWYLDQVRRYRDHPDYPNGAAFNAMREMIAGQGYRILLTGIGGDECLTGSYYHYADLLRRGSLLALWRQRQHDKKIAGICFPRFPVWEFGIRPVAPGFARKVVRAFKKPYHGPAWITRQFAARVGLGERLRARGQVGSHLPNHVQRHVYRMIFMGATRHSNEMEERGAAYVGLELRQPFRDRRIVEFTFAIPDEQRWKKHLTKYVLRQAITGLVPESVRQRLSKGEFIHLFLDAMRAVGGERLFRSLAVADAGWVDHAQILEMYRNMEAGHGRGDPHYADHAWPLWNVLGIELWLQTLDCK